MPDVPFTIPYYSLQTFTVARDTFCATAPVQYGGRRIYNSRSAANRKRPFRLSRGGTNEVPSLR